MSAHDRKQSAQPGRFVKWARVGTDSFGSRHYVNFERGYLYVVTASGQLEHVQDLRNAQLEEWMEYVADARGWLDRQYGGSLFDGLAELAEGNA